MTTQENTFATIPQKRSAARQKRIWRERLLMGITISVVLAAWLYGYFTSGADIVPLVSNVLPGAVRVEQQGQLFVGLDDQDQLIGYAAVGQASGYGGPIETLVGVAPSGQILGVQVVSRRESPGFFRLLEDTDLVGQISQQQISAPLQIGNDLDAVSGATISAEGVANSVRRAARQIAADGLAAPLPPEQRPIQFGFPEMVLIGLYAAGYAGHKLRRPAWKRRIRWVTLLTGLVVLGFIYTAPLTITMVVSLLSGFWPDWHSNLYWYLLIGGILFVTTVDAKNPYCSWFCPFGAFQECMAAVSGAKPYRPRSLAQPLKWVQRGLALAAVVLGLALRRPGVASYEPFATLFNFQGTPLTWILLILVVLTSLAVYRPFCNYLCPIDPVVDFVATGRRWLKEVWATWQSRPSSR